MNPVCCEAAGLPHWAPDDCPVTTALLTLHEPIHQELRLISSGDFSIADNIVAPDSADCLPENRKLHLFRRSANKIGLTIVAMSGKRPRSAA